MIERKVCPLCHTPCYLRVISSFDPSGEKYGAMFACPRCQWDDWGTIVQPNEIRDFSERCAKEGDTYDQEVAKEKAKERARREAKKKERK